jgi:hypothetical protein
MQALYQLSYGPILPVSYTGRRFIFLIESLLTFKGDDERMELVEPSGIEPLTSCMPCRRSTN